MKYGFFLTLCRGIEVFRKLCTHILHDLLLNFTRYWQCIIHNVYKLSCPSDKIPNCSGQSNIVRRPLRQLPEEDRARHGVAEKAKQIITYSNQNEIARTIHRSKGIYRRFKTGAQRKERGTECAIKTQCTPLFLEKYKQICKMPKSTLNWTRFRI